MDTFLSSWITIMYLTRNGDMSRDLPRNLSRPYIHPPISMTEQKADSMRFMICR